MAIETLSCGECGIEFCVPANWVKERRNDHRTWYCPNGHCRVFKGQSEEEKLRLERDRLNQRLAQKDDAIRAEREAREGAERRAAAARGQVTKLKKRAAAGVCPCCNRTFLDLQRHMASKHAGFVAEEVQGEVGKAVH